MIDGTDSSPDQVNGRSFLTMIITLHSWQLVYVAAPSLQGDSVEVPGSQYFISLLSSSLSAGWDGGVEIWDAGDEGHVHGGRCLPAAGPTATAWAGACAGGYSNYTSSRLFSLFFWIGSFPLQNFHKKYEFFEQQALSSASYILWAFKQSVHLEQMFTSPVPVDLATPVILV